MRKNIASQTVSFQAVSTADGSAVTSGTPAVYVTIDRGTQTTGSGTVTHEGNGCWSYAPTQAETNGNHISFTFALSGAVSQTVNVYTVSYDPHDTVRLGITALPNAAAASNGGVPTVSDAWTKLMTSAGQIVQGTVATATTAASTTNFSASDITEATADHYNGRIIIFTSGDLEGQATRISDYALVSSEGNFTVVALTEAPVNGDTFIIV